MSVITCMCVVNVISTLEQFACFSIHCDIILLHTVLFNCTMTAVCWKLLLFSSFFFVTILCSAAPSFAFGLQDQMHCKLDPLALVESRKIVNFACDTQCSQWNDILWPKSFHSPLPQFTNNDFVAHKTALTRFLQMHERWEKTHTPTSSKIWMTYEWNIWPQMKWKICNFSLFISQSHFYLHLSLHLILTWRGEAFEKLLRIAFNKWNRLRLLWSMECNSDWTMTLIGFMWLVRWFFFRNRK